MTSNPLDTMPIGPIGFGTAELGNLYRQITELQAWDVLQAAHESGVTLFDSSPSYGLGLSELRMGAFLRSLPRQAYVLATKVGRYIDKADLDPEASPFMAPLPFKGVFDYTYDGTMRSFEQSILRMGIPHIDLLLLHDLDRRNHGDAFEAQYEIAQKGAFRAMAELKAAGDVSAIGIAVNESDTAARMLCDGDFDGALLAGRYTLLDQSALNDFFPTAESRNVRILLGGIYNSGILATGTVSTATYNYKVADADIVARVKRIEAVCARHHMPLAKAALRFVLAHPQVRTTLIGTTRPERLASTQEFTTGDIPLGLWSDLKMEGLIAHASPVPGD